MRRTRMRLYNENLYKQRKWKNYSHVSPIICQCTGCSWRRISWFLLSRVDNSTLLNGIRPHFPYGQSRRQLYFSRDPFWRADPLCIRKPAERKTAFGFSIYHARKAITCELTILELLANWCLEFASGDQARWNLFFRSSSRRTVASKRGVSRNWDKLMALTLRR